MSTTHTMPALTSLAHLCSSCHARAPRYRCPRCSTRTCSAACVRVHKQRTLCSGTRDPGAYASRRELNTAAAFDRDFNFISGVERGIERAARESENRGIDVQRKEEDDNEEFWTGRGGRGSSSRGRGRSQSRGARGGRGASRGGSIARQRPAKGTVPLQKSLRRDGLTVLRAPKGMSREKDNNTHWRPRKGGVSWTVEWIRLVDGSETRPAAAASAASSVAEKGLTQLFEEQSVSEGLAEWRAKTTRNAKRKRDSGEAVAEDVSSSRQGRAENTRWDLALHAVDDISRGRDGEPAGTNARSTGATPGKKRLLPFDHAIKLKDLLRGQTVREFPTIYVWQQRDDEEEGEETEGQAPGPEFVMGEKVQTPPPAATEGSAETPPADAGHLLPSDGITGDDTVGDDTVGDDDDEEGEVEDDSNDNEEGDDGQDEENNKLTEELPARLQIERGVQVAADSNLGIGGAIAAALMADADTMGDEI